MFVAFLAVVCLLFVSACSNGSGTSSTDNSTGSSTNNASKSYSGQTITVAITAQEPTKELKLFTKKTGIKVKWVSIGWDALQKKITAAATAHTHFADVTDVDWSRVGLYNQTKWFIPLNKYFDIKKLKKDVPQLGSFVVGGKLWGIPNDASIMATSINKRDFGKAGIKKTPKTISQYTKDLQKVKKSGVNQHPLGIPFTAAEGLSTYWYETTAAFGGHLFGKGYKPLFKSPSSAGYKAMKWMTDAYKSGLVPKGDINSKDVEISQSQMAQHRISSIFSDYATNKSSVYDVKGKSKVVGQVNYIPTPGKNGKHPNLGNPDGVGIPATSKHVGAAVKFIKWFTSTKVQADLSGLNGSGEQAVGFPMRLSSMKLLEENASNDNSKNNLNQLIKLYKNNTQPVFPNGPPPWYSQFSESVYTNIHSVAAGNETVDEAINKIVKVVNEQK